MKFKLDGSESRTISANDHPSRNLWNTFREIEHIARSGREAPRQIDSLGWIGVSYRALPKDIHHAVHLKSYSFWTLLVHILGADPHWRPQTFNCGLSEFLPRFSYIGSLDKTETQSRELLEEVGLWDDFGKYYHWNVNKSENRGFECSLFPPELKVGEELIGFQQHPQANYGSHGNSATDTAYGHSTSAQSKLAKYYTPKLMETVKRLYRNDFELWDIVKSEDKFLSGSELAVKMSRQCHGRAWTMSNFEQGGKF